MNLWMILQESLNFTIKMKVSEDCDKTDGNMIENGTWTSVLGMLQRLEIDVAHMPITMSSSRLDVVDFTMPAVEMRTQVMIRRPDEIAMQWNATLLPFCWKLWVAVGVAMVVLTLCLATADWLIRHYVIIEDRNFGFKEAMFIVYSAICQQAYDDVPSSASLRTLFVTTYLTGMLLLGCYSAGFITNLTLRDPTLPFTDFEGLLKDGTYRLGMALVNEQLDYFRNSSSKLLREVYEKLIAPNEANFAHYDKVGLTLLCHEKKYAHFGSAYMLFLKGHRPPCSFTVIPRAYYPGMFTIATAKKSPYQGILNFRLQQMRNAGFVKGVYRQFTFELWLATHSDDRQKMSVELYDVVPIFVILAVGIATSLVLFLVETCRHSLLLLK